MPMQRDQIIILFLAKRLGVIATILIATALAGCSKAGDDSQSGAHWRIGFSQVTIAEPWRALFNKQVRYEAAKHPELELVIADGQDQTGKQIADIQNFIDEHVDLILVSPKEPTQYADVLAKAEAAGIPVIVLDRDVNTRHYTQFIGSSNRKIGQLAGDYAVKLLGGPGKAHGTLLEIWGGKATTPAQDRHAGFAAAVDQVAGIVRVSDGQDGDWKQEKAYNIMSAALKANPRIDLVYAHNDSMAYGAYLAAKDAGRTQGIQFLGIDGMPDLGGRWVKEGSLTATFVYPLPGAEGVRQAIKILNGKSVPRRIELPTEQVDADNIASFLDRNDETE